MNPALINPSIWIFIFNHDGSKNQVLYPVFLNDIICSQYGFLSLWSSQAVESILAWDLPLVLDNLALAAAITADKVKPHAAKASPLKFDVEDMGVN